MSNEPPAKPPPNHDRMVLRCPICGVGWSIGLDNVPPKVLCQRCRQWYRVDARGLTPIDGPTGEPIEVMVRTGLSDWKAHRLRWSPRTGCNSEIKSRWVRLKQYFQSLEPKRWIQIGTAALLALIVVAVWSGSAIGRSGPEERPLPSALDERAPLWVKAWLDRDTATLLRFSDRSRDRALRHWLQLHPPPDESLALPNSDKINVLGIEKKNDDLAMIKVQIDQASGARGGNPMQLQWTRHDDIWYFEPQVAKKRSR